MSAPENARPQAARPLLGDEADLFRDFHAQLVRIVQDRTRSSRDTVDDACAYAWQRFIQYQPDRERAWRSWLVTTAEREVWRLHGVEARHISFSIDDPDPVGTESWDIANERDPTVIRLRLREALEAFARLPERRRDIKALHIAGSKYEEIEDMRGCRGGRPIAVPCWRGADAGRLPPRLRSRSRRRADWSSIDFRRIGRGSTAPCCPARDRRESRASSQAIGVDRHGRTAARTSPVLGLAK